jgi:diguanylate cyclase
VHNHHQWIFTALSIAIAIMGAWTALDLFQRVRARTGQARATWLAIAAVAMGSSIWSMHFVAMLGFDPGAPVTFDLSLTAASLVLAIGGTAGAFFAAAWRGKSLSRLVAAGVAMGLAIGAMHYVGMAALRTAVSIDYRPGLVAVSLGIAIAASTAALWAARQDGSTLWRVTAALGLGLAITGMHHAGMAALILTPIEASVTPALPGVPPIVLALVVAGGTGSILFIALAASLYDQRQTLVEVLDAGGIGYWEFQPRTGLIEASSRARSILGLGAASIDEAAWSRAFAQDAATRLPRLGAAMATADNYNAEHQLSDGRWVSLRGRVLKDRAGRPLRMAGVLLDVTDRESAFTALAESERRQRLLINELNHRVKNTLATIQAIATLTAHRAASVPDFVAAFEARLIALSSTHNLLTAQGWEKAELQGLLDKEFRPYAPEQVRLRGPVVWLHAEQALALGLVFHELATNAAKYGALSTPEGCVTVSWTSLNDRLALEWEERGGPGVGPPQRTGFGSRLIRTSVEGTLQGALALRYDAEGLEADIAFALRPHTVEL